MLTLKELPKSPDLVLIDSFNVLYKFHHKLRLLTTSSGIPCGGLYGVLRNMDSIIKSLETPRMVWVFDSIPSEKRSIDASYKMNRSRTREIDPQVEGMLEFFKVLRIPFLKVEGREADDLIAQLLFLAHNWNDIRHAGSNAVFLIFSEDHDMLQNLNENTFLYKHRTGEIVSAEDIVEEYHIPPWRLPEIWAICGCGGDNVEGVPGFGEKKATRMIEKWGSLKDALENDDKLSKHRERILTNFLLVKQSGTQEIPYDICHSSLTHYNRRAWNKEKLSELLSKWEFKSLERYWLGK